MAGLGEDDGSGELAVAKLAAHERVGHVPVGHVFPEVEGDELTEGAAIDDLVDAPIEGRVSEHMTDLEHSLRRLGGFDDAHALSGGRRDGLLQQHVVAPGECRQGGLHVQCVAGGDDRQGSQAVLPQQLLPVAKAPLLGDAVLACHLLPLLVIGSASAAMRRRSGLARA